MPGAREAAARRAAHGGVAVPLVAASLAIEAAVAAAAGLVAQLGKEGGRPAAKKAGKATAETREESARLVALVAAGASADCATRGWVARSATYVERRRARSSALAGRKKVVTVLVGSGGYTKTGKGRKSGPGYLVDGRVISLACRVLAVARATA